MTPKAQTAYQTALQKIESCRQLERAAEFLNLSHLGLTQVPPEIGQLSFLKELLIADNQLTSLPPEIGQLSALKQLDLDNNQLTSLPPEIGQLSALTRLDLDNNQLASLPPEIGRLSALMWLDLHNNQLTSLPQEMGQLSKETLIKAKIGKARFFQRAHAFFLPLDRGKELPDASP